MKHLDFETGYELLLKYKEEHHNLNVPKNYVVNGYRLGEFVYRKREMKESLSKYQYEKLDELGFIWSLQDYNFFYMANLLIEYGREYGTKDIPKSLIYRGEKLGVWVCSIRAGRKTLSFERENYLNAIGFIFEPEKYRFENNLALYKKACSNNISVPVDRKLECDNVKIGEWAYNLKRFLIKLSMEQYQELLCMGFPFDMRLYNKEKILV